MPAMIDTEPLQQYIRTHFLFDPDARLAADQELFPAIIDSLGVMELVEFVEKTYDVEIDDSELLVDHFRTLATISALVERKRASR